MALETLWDVVTTASWMDHGAHHLDVHNVDVVSGLFQVVESLLLNHLASDFIGHLQNCVVTKLCGYEVMSLRGYAVMCLRCYVVMR